MDEQTRRGEILQAEEAIRQLAGEMARAVAAADGAEANGRRFDQAVAVLAEARDRIAAIAEQADAITQSSRSASESLASAGQASRETAEQARTLLADAAGKMSASVRQAAEQSRQRFDECVAALAGAREQLGEAASSAAAMGEAGRKALREALDSVRGKLDEAGEKVFNSIAGFEEVRQQFSRVGEELATRQARMIQNIETRLGEMSMGLSAMSMAIQDIKGQPGGNGMTRLAQTIGAELARQTRVLVFTIIAAAVGLGGALVLLYVLFGKGL